MAINKEDIKVGLVYRRSCDDTLRTITRIEPDDKYKTRIYYKSKYSKESWNTIGELTSGNGSIHFVAVGHEPQGEIYEIF